MFISWSFLPPNISQQFKGGIYTKAFEGLTTIQASHNAYPQRGFGGLDTSSGRQIGRKTECNKSRPVTVRPLPFEQNHALVEGLLCEVGDTDRNETSAGENHHSLHSTGFCLAKSGKRSGWGASLASRWPWRFPGDAVQRHCNKRQSSDAAITSSSSSGLESQTFAAKGWDVVQNSGILTWFRTRQKWLSDFLMIHIDSQIDIYIYTSFAKPKST